MFQAYKITFIFPPSSTLPLSCWSDRPGYQSCLQKLQSNKVPLLHSSQSLISINNLLRILNNVDNNQATKYLKFKDMYEQLLNNRLFCRKSTHKHKCFKGSFQIWNGYICIHINFEYHFKGPGKKKLKANATNPSVIRSTGPGFFFFANCS